MASMGAIDDCRTARATDPIIAPATRPRPRVDRHTTHDPSSVHASVDEQRRVVSDHGFGPLAVVAATAEGASGMPLQPPSPSLGGGDRDGYQLGVEPLAQRAGSRQGCEREPRTVEREQHVAEAGRRWSARRFMATAWRIGRCGRQGSSRRTAHLSSPLQEEGGAHPCDW
jgi:hypothetical protein